MYVNEAGLDSVLIKELLVATEPWKRQQVRRLITVLNDQTPSNKAKFQSGNEVHARTKLLIRTIKNCAFIRVSCYTLASQAQSDATLFDELLALRATGSELLRHA